MREWLFSRTLARRFPRGLNSLPDLGESLGRDLGVDRERVTPAGACPVTVRVLSESCVIGPSPRSAVNTGRSVALVAGLQCFGR